MSQRTGRSQEIHHRYTTIYILLCALFLVVAFILSLIAVRFNWLPILKAEQGEGGTEAPTETVTPSVPETPTVTPTAPTTEENGTSLPPDSATEFLEYSTDKLAETHMMTVVSADHPFTATPSGMVEFTNSNRGGMALNAYNIKVKTELYDAMVALQADLNAHFPDSDWAQMLVLVGYNDGTKAYHCNHGSLEAASYSDHATGYAIDIRFKNGDTYGIPSTESGYLRKVCAKYGLIVDSIATNAKSLHLRYVGVPYAEFLTEKSLTVESFYQEVKGYNYNRRLEFVANADGADQLYQFYYVSAQESGTTRIPVPKAEQYTVLSNGSDGYVVAVKKTS